MPEPTLPTGAPSPPPGHPQAQTGAPFGDVIRTPVPCNADGAAAVAAPAVPGYEIVAEVGRGGMGVVYKAWQTALDRTVALKMILAGAHAGTEERRRFQTEAEAAARLQHANIVQVYEVGEAGGLPYLSLEFCPGGSLADRLRGEPLPPQEAARLAETLARAVQAAHAAGIVHRDLKPSNVLLTGDGTPKISDFGLAKRLDGRPGQTASGAVLGTPSYMAPEQAGGRSKEVGPATDVYALGAILYELLTQRPPFRAANPLDTLLLVLSEELAPPSRLRPGVPRDLEAVVLKCLEKDPARRYATAGELAEDVRRFLHGDPIRARHVGRAERLVRWCRRNPRVAVLAGSSAILLLALTAVLVRGPGSPAPLPREVTTHKARPADPEEERRRIGLLLQDANIQMSAVARGTQYLLAQGHPLRAANVGYPLGVTCFRALTLLECGVPPTEPVIQKDAEQVRKQAPKATDTYQKAIAVLFLDRLGDKQDEECIQSLALCLLAGQRADDGGWGYACPTLDRKATASLLKQLREEGQLAVRGFDPGRSDNSNTQFAVLALWAARRHGVPIRRATALVEQRFRSTQLGKGPDPTGNLRDLDGAWPYQRGQSASAWPSMTCAGLVSLAVAHGAAEEGAPEKQILGDDAIRRGLALLGREIDRADEKRRPDLFFLWSLERVGVLYNLQMIGEKDWYDWGRRVLLPRQQLDGSWNEGGSYPGSNPVLGTCFALLFLKQSNLTTDLANKLHHLVEEP